MLAVPSIDYCLTWKIFAWFGDSSYRIILFLAEACGSRRLLIYIMPDFIDLTQLVGIWEEEFELDYEPNAERVEGAELVIVLI